MMNEETTGKCINIARSICTNPKYGEWLNHAISQADTGWKSVIAEVFNQNCSIDEILELPEDVRPVFVYTCIKGPYFKQSGEVVFLFKLAGWIWSTVINITPSSPMSSPL